MPMKTIMHFSTTSAFWVMLLTAATTGCSTFNSGGVYHYDGDATPTNFFSTYKSKYDHGTFQMTRP